MKKWAMDDIIERIGQGDQSQEIIDHVLALRGEDQALFLKRIEALKSHSAGRLLTLVCEKTTDKTLQKAIKKSLFHLRTQGIAIEEPRQSGESVLRKTAEAYRDAQALMSNYDGELTRIVVAAFEMKKNQFALSHAVIHFSKGLLELRSLPLTRVELGRVMDDYRSRSLHPLVFAPISAPYAGFMVEEGSRLSKKETDEAQSLSRYLSEAKGDVRTASDIYGLSVNPSVVSASMGEVITNEIFEPFHLEWQDMEEDRKAYQGAVNPTIVLPPYVIQERIEAFLKDLALSKRFRTQAPRFRRMLEDTAYLFYCMGRPDYCMSLIGVLKDETSANKALIYFAQKTLQDLAKKTDQKRELIVDPFSQPPKTRP
jgi:hypothetical protein